MQYIKSNSAASIYPKLIEDIDILIINNPDNSLVSTYQFPATKFSNNYSKRRVECGNLIKLRTNELKCDE